MNTIKRVDDVPNRDIVITATAKEVEYFIRRLLLLDWNAYSKK